MRTWLRSLAESVPDEEVVAALAAHPLEVVDGDAAAGILVLGEIGDRAVAATRELSRDGRDRVFVITSAPAGAMAWRLLEAGAGDAVSWTLGASSVATIVAARLQRWAAIDELVASPVVRDNLVGHSRAWTSILRRVVEVARFSDAPVLVTGESGTGKELAARLIHALDARPRRGALVVLDCTTVVAELAGSEFFGHERGAFTGAVGARDGAFALADGGTLFLDEIGELPAPLQAQLLRVVQERSYKRVGGNTWQHSDFRLVRATNRDLRAEVDRGRFRRDLYHRIASAVVTLPPLRERPEDILPLVEHFLVQLRSGPPLALDDAVRALLVARDYPGNVRDLRQLVQRIAYRHVGGGPVTVGDVPPEECADALGGGDWRRGSLEVGVARALAMGIGLKEIGRGAEELAVSLALNDSDGNLQRAARVLGVTDRALQLRRALRRAE